MICMITIAIKPNTKLTTYNGLSGYVSFPYNAGLIQEIKSYPSSKRFWHAEKKLWELDVNWLPQFIEHCGNKPITLTGRNAPVLPQLKAEETRELPFDIYDDEQLMKFLHTRGITSTLYHHQLEAVRYGYTKGNMFLTDEPGCGKSLSVIALALLKQYLCGFQTTLIVTGVNSLKWNFYKDVLKHTNLDCFTEVEILGMRPKYHDYGTAREHIEQGDLSDLIIGGTKEKLERLRHWHRFNKILITNIETIRNDEICAEINKLCNEGKIGQIVVDECHKCANPEAHQTKNFIKLKPMERIPMTGTPLLNTPLDLWSYLYWMGIETESFYKYKLHYCRMGGYKDKQVVGYKNLSQLQTVLDGVMLRRYKKDILDLPEKFFYEEYVEMGDLQSKLYELAQNEVLANLDEILESPNPLVALLRMRQATGNTWTLTKNLKTRVFDGVQCAKLERLKELVEERTKNGVKCVIFTNWVEVAEGLEEALKGYNPLMVHGKIKEAEKNKNRDLFQDDPNRMVLIGTTNSMGTGFNLTAARCAIFMDEPWTYADFTQASDRLHRIGATGSIDIISLITKETVDERIHNIILQKKGLSDFVVNGANKSSKAETLRYLLGISQEEFDKRRKK